MAKAKKKVAKKRAPKLTQEQIREAKKEAYLNDLQQLTIKHGLMIQPVLRTTENSIAAVNRIVEVVKKDAVVKNI